MGKKSKKKPKQKPPRKEQSKSKGNLLLVYGGIFLLALAVRVFHVLQMRNAPFFHLLIGDAKSYDAWARTIAGGDWIGQEIFYQAPLYPYFLGVVYAVFKTDPLVARLIQAVLSALACVFLALAGRKLFSKAAGIVGCLTTAAAVAVFCNWPRTPRHPLKGVMLYNVGKKLASEGRNEQAIDYYRKSLELLPSGYKAHCQLGHALRVQGRLQEAMMEFKRALEIKPEYSDARYALSDLLRSDGRIDEAIGQYRLALQYEPNREDIHYDLALTLTVSGWTQEALTHFEEAIRLQPGWSDPLNNAAWILSSHPGFTQEQRQRGLHLAKRAAEITQHQEPTILDTLGVAYASVGRFKEAIETTEKAIALQLEAGGESPDPEMTAHLQLYKERKPYIEAKQKPVQGDTGEASTG